MQKPPSFSIDWKWNDCVCVLIFFHFKYFSYALQFLILCLAGILWKENIDETMNTVLLSAS